MRTFVWQGIDEPRMEIVHVESLDRARGTQIGVAYELRWQLAGSELTVDAGAGPVRHRLDGADYFDLQHSAFFNSLPVVRDELLNGTPAPRDYTMRFVSVPDTAATLTAQRYEPRGGHRVGFVSGDYRAEIDFDDAGFVLLYHDYLRRLHP
ncbi:putative glycolipid-binding domain-containing protein [Nocardia blacklockiae]|uniref:putative glycolipid-binding domain-containing protein n=1 Tax=Nocardia blacklockiae TaxID=480036 RepID=UPI0018941732|nr:putative glycolipid-binding domain-containing protein [Nocardia blacklockiae]MBF6173796.1 putative glycolipid-binding domain-containing protein [Nocardia blacklockiae]